MPQYSVNEPLKHDGQAYAPGDTVEMDAKAAKALLALGTLGPAVKAAAKTEPKAKASPDAAGDGDASGEAEEGK
jgi:hypothetical protein